MSAEDLKAWLDGLVELTQVRGAAKVKAR
jgi:hypothetical protein